MTQRIFRTLAAPSIAAAAVALCMAPGASAQGTRNEASTKLKKHIGVMEKILDETLVGSPNLLVGSQHVTRGIYLKEFGVLFSFEAALLSQDRGEWWDKIDWSKFKVETKDGKTVIQFPSDEEDGDSKNAKGSKGAQDENAKEKSRSREERYESGKAELVSALLDYGETLAGLQDDQWVGIAAFFDEEETLGDRRVSSVLIKAKVADLRAYGAERLSRKEMENRLVVEEN
jgi:hypothetical protein